MNQSPGHSINLSTAYVRVNEDGLSISSDQHEDGTVIAVTDPKAKQVVDTGMLAGLINEEIATKLKCGPDSLDIILAPVKVKIAAVMSVAHTRSLVTEVLSFGTVAHQQS